MAVGGSGGSGGADVEYDCTGTQLTIEPQPSPGQASAFGNATLTGFCQDTHGASFHDGPSTYELTSGSVTSAHIDACADDATVTFEVASGTQSGDHNMISATIVDGTDTWQLVAGSGTLTVSTEGDVGQIVEGTYDATMEKGQSPGLALQAVVQGAFRLCRVPDLVDP